MTQRRTSPLYIAIPVLFVLLVIGAAAWYVTGHNVPVMQPRGDIALAEQRLILLALALSAIVVVPVFTMTIVIAWRYRENNHAKVEYRPNWDSSKLYESIWWGIPILIIGVLCVVTWISSHELDPYRHADLGGKPLTVEVVAMDWKWLFIYPDEHVATVNELVIPTDTTIHFDLTSDSVMNSFWIPQLGSQIYAMPGMSTSLHLNATEPGTYYGSPANINGSGFSSMTFRVKALESSEYQQWLTRAQQVNTNLTLTAYNELAKPSTNHPVTIYAPVQDDLYDTLVMKYMSHSNSMPTHKDPSMTMEHQH